MPGPIADYFAYKRWFETGHDALRLPPNCTEPEPPTLFYSDLYTWSVEWYLIFADPDAYIRIFENFAKRSRMLLSRRIHFAYHYGPLIRKDNDGRPDRQSSDPVIVRVDNIGRAAHLHPENDPTAHIPQERIHGLDLENLDLFDFVKAAFRHRTTGTAIERTLGYRII